MKIGIYTTLIGVLVVILAFCYVNSQIAYMAAEISSLNRLLDEYRLEEELEYKNDNRILLDDSNKYISEGYVNINPQTMLVDIVKWEESHLYEFTGSVEMQNPATREWIPIHAVRGETIRLAASYSETGTSVVYYICYTNSTVCEGQSFETGISAR